MKRIEELFEAILWHSRLLTLFAVIFAVIGSVALFILGSLDILKAVKMVFYELGNAHSASASHDIIVGSLIGAVDLYLIAIVLLLFGFGVYELFVSKIDIAHYQNRQNNLFRRRNPPLFYRPKG